MALADVHGLLQGHHAGDRARVREVAGIALAVAGKDGNALDRAAVGGTPNLIGLRQALHFDAGDDVLQLPEAVRREPVVGDGDEPSRDNHRADLDLAWPVLALDPDGEPAWLSVHATDLSGGEDRDRWVPSDGSDQLVGLGLWELVEWSSARIGAIEPSHEATELCLPLD